MNLNRNPWNAWGFKGNPFDTSALTMYSRSLPISKAFVGRAMDSSESRHLLDIVRNPGGGRGIVEGAIGVGKTTLVNYHRYLWENEADEKLISPLREISVYGKWEAKDFLMEILGHVSNKMLHLLKQKKLKKSKLLKKIRFLYDIFYQESIEFEASLFGVGVGYGRQAQINLPHITESQLIAYLMDMVDEVKKMGYEGIILHFDNLELLSQRDFESCRQLFEEIRDIMQLPDIYFIFVAQKGFYSQIVGPSERVRSIMGWPVKVNPLTIPQVIEAVNIRYKLLSINPGHEIRPVSDDFIVTLYDLYQGKIRFIMDSIAQLVSFRTRRNPTTFQDREAQQALLKIVRFKTDCLSPREHQTLLAALDFEEFTNDDLAKLSGMKRPNISHILKRLAEENFVYVVRREGRHVYYTAVDELKVLRKFKKKITAKRKPTISLRISKKIRYKNLFKHLSKYSQITRTEYQKLTKISTSTAKRDLTELVKQSKLQKTGAGKSTIYILTE